MMMMMFFGHLAGSHGKSSFFLKDSTHESAISMNISGILG